ncbi:MAG TPA: lipoate--protein ligase family protein [Nitrospiria bacterium]|nr:lipoate--protein ligase family protein [Nitrospiria bacterium]
MDTWRLIMDPPSPAGYNMAVDEALADACRRGLIGPTLRLYEWDRPSISLGYFQRPEAIVDLERCRDAGVPVVRRTTGGRAVYHHREVTYSIVAPTPHPLFAPTIRGAYEVVARALASGLTDLGLRVELHPRDPGRPRRGARTPLCFDSTSRSELTLRGRKVVGSAQRRWPAAVLQHGSILLAYDSSEAESWFLGHAAAAESITGLDAGRRDISPDDVRRALCSGVERTFGVRLLLDTLSPDEADAVAQSSQGRDLTVTQVV